MYLLGAVAVSARSARFCSKFSFRFDWLSKTMVRSLAGRVWAQCACGYFEIPWGGQTRGRTGVCDHKTSDCTRIQRNTGIGSSMAHRTDFAEKDFERNLALCLISKDLRPFERATGGRSFLPVSSFITGERILSELKLLQRQENTHRSKVCKFKLYYSRKFWVLRSTKISNTFLCNSRPRDVSIIIWWYFVIHVAVIYS